MDALNMFIQVPSWAYDFCFYYMALAAVVIVSSVWTLIKLFMLPAVILKSVPFVTLVIALLLSTVVSVVLIMMQFWVCRSALAPRVEKFADKCKSNADCLAINGPQNSDLCTCGARGVCAGCQFNNHTKNSMMREYNEPLSGTEPSGYWNPEHSAM